MAETIKPEPEDDSPWMIGADVKAARERLGDLWKKDRPLFASELARALRLRGRDPGASVALWEKGEPITGPVSALITLYLAGILPPDGIPQSHKTGRHHHFSGADNPKRHPAWAKGTSGNPGGRPKKQKPLSEPNRNILRAVAPPSKQDRLAAAAELGRRAARAGNDMNPFSDGELREAWASARATALEGGAIKDVHIVPATPVGEAPNSDTPLDVPAEPENDIP